MGSQNKSSPQEYGLDMTLSYRVLQGIVCKFIPFLDGKGRVFKRELNSDFWVGVGGGGGGVVST